MITSIAKTQTLYDSHRCGCCDDCAYAYAFDVSCVCVSYVRRNTYAFCVFSFLPEPPAISSACPFSFSSSASSRDIPSDPSGPRHRICVVPGIVRRTM